MKKEHNLSEEYLQSQSDEELEKEMMEWTAEEQAEYLCPDGVMTIEEFREYGIKMIIEEYDRMERKITNTTANE